MAYTDYLTTVQKYYVAYYGRPADPVGQEYWAKQLDAAKGNPATIINAFGNSAEATALFGSMTNEQKINKIYQQCFGRDADATGLLYYSNGIAAGTFTVASIMMNVADGATGTDATAIGNKLTSSALFTTSLSTDASALVNYTGAGVTTVKTWLNGITTTAADQTSVNTVIAAEKAAGGGSATGTTYTLTSGVDIITGTANNDTIIGDNTTATKTLTAADQIDGGGGIDTLKVYLAAGDTATGQPTGMTNVEKVYINGGAITAYTAATGTTDLSIDSQVVNTAATFTLSGQTLTLANHTATGATTTTVASTTDTVENITLSAFKGGTNHTLDLSGTKQATLNLTASGTASAAPTNQITLTNTGAALTKVTVAGSSDITVTESLAAVKTIDASTNTGGVTFDVSGATMNIAFAFTGGTGNDKLTVAAGNLAVGTGLTSGAQIDFGAGTDTLVIKDTTPVYSTINDMKNLEVLNFGVNAGSVNMANLTIGKVAFGGFSTGTVSNLESTDAVTIGGAMATSVTVGGAVGNSSGTINLGSATTGGFTVASLVTTGLTNIALTSNGTNAGANIITAMTNSDNSSFTITGSNDLTMAVTKAATVTGDKIDASAFTGKLTAVASDLADILKGGSAADTITGGGGVDTITGGGGADKFRYAAVADNASATGANVDKITDFVCGTDKIAIQGDAGANNTLAGLTLVTTVTTAATMLAGITDTNSVASISDVYTRLAVDLANGSGTEFAVSAATAAGLVARTVTFSTGAAAGTYLVINDGTAAFQAANDLVINITGVTGTFAASDITMIA